LYDIIPVGTMTIGGQKIPLDKLPDQPRVSAVLTPEAWEFNAQLESKLTVAAAGSYYSMLSLPTFERLSRSLLKLAVLLAASRQEPRDNMIDVEVRDIGNAARYIQEWGQFS